MSPVTMPSRPHPAASQLLSLSLIACGLVSLLGAGELLPVHRLEIAVLMVVAAAANLVAVRGDRGSAQVETGGGFIPILMAALAYGSGAAVYVAFASSVPYFDDRRRALRVAATRVIAGASVATLLADRNLAAGQTEAFLLWGFACAALYQVLAWAMNGVVLTVEQGEPLGGLLRRLAPHFALGLMLFGPMAVAFAYLLPQAPLAVALPIFAVIASHRMLSTLERSRSMERLLSTMSAEIPGALLAALDAADAYTAKHSAAVASYAYDLALAGGLSKSRARWVHAAALLHDVGKIGVPDAVLNKDGHLDDDEWQQIRKHPELGANLIKRLPGFEVLEPAILHHHERLDGGGYPHGIAGDLIPEEAQIIAIADTYSAITTSRVYRGARSADIALRELRKDGAAGKLNSDLVEIFCVLIADKDENYQAGEHTTLAAEVERVRGWLGVHASQ